MPSKSSHVTIDQEEIRRWAEERGAHPATVKGTGQEARPGIIVLDFPGYSGGEKLEPISWDDFFDKFEESRLALVYSEKNNFNKLVSRESVDLETGELVAPPRRRRKQAERGRAPAKRSDARKVGAKKKAGAKKAAPRRASRSSTLERGVRRAPRSAAGRTVGQKTGKGSQRGGARQSPERRGSSRGSRSRK